MTVDVVETLCQLVRISSVNPMGTRELKEPCGEGRLTDFLQQFFQRLGVPWHRQRVAAGRDNILARVEGTPPSDERILVWEAHQDTVPVDGMTIEPFEPTVRDGRVYGRGSCDVKGGMASMLAAFARLAELRPAGMPTLVMACSVNEEYGFTGAQEMARAWQEGSLPLITCKPAGVIVAEPTELDVVVCHKGVVRWQCRATGRAAHSSCPAEGENAIYRMGHLLVALEEYAQHVAEMAPHFRIGAPTINVGTIQGGICVNAVPDACSIEIDRRLLPDEDPEAAQQHAVDWLTSQLPDPSWLEHGPPYLASPGLTDQADSDLTRRLRAVVRDHSLPGNVVGVPYATDAPAFSALGIPTVVFGPGSIKQAHTACEWVAIDQLQTATRIFTALGQGWN